MGLALLCLSVKKKKKVYISPFFPLVEGEGSNTLEARTTSRRPLTSDGAESAGDSADSADSTKPSCSSSPTGIGHHGGHHGGHEGVVAVAAAAVADGPGNRDNLAGAARRAGSFCRHGDDCQHHADRQNVYQLTVP